MDVPPSRVLTKVIIFEPIVVPFFYTQCWYLSYVTSIIFTISFYKQMYPSVTEVNFTFLSSHTS